MSEDDVDRIGAGQRFVRHGKEVCWKLSPAEKTEFDAAKFRGYVIGRGRRWNLPNVWFHWCRVKRLPYVVVNRRHKFAEVSLDLYDLCDRELSDEGVALAQSAMRTHGQLPSDCHLSKTYCSLHRVPLIRADDLAREFLRIATVHFEYRRGYEPVAI